MRIAVMLLVPLAAFVQGAETRSADGEWCACSGELGLLKETEHALFYSPNSPEEIGSTLEVLAEALESNYTRITGMFRYESDAKIPIHVYAHRQAFQKMIGRRTEGTYVGEEKTIKLYTPADLSDPVVRSEYTDQIVHEFVHAVVLQINPFVTQVKWLDEGVAYFAGNQLVKDLRSKRALADFPTLEELSSPDYFRNAGGAAYFYNGLLVRYIVNVHGLDALNKIIRRPYELECILDTSIPQLYEDWREASHEERSGLPDW